MGGGGSGVIEEGVCTGDNQEVKYRTSTMNTDDQSMDEEYVLRAEDQSMDDECVLQPMPPVGQLEQQLQQKAVNNVSVSDVNKLIGSKNVSMSIDEQSSSQVHFFSFLWLHWTHL